MSTPTAYHLESVTVAHGPRVVLDIPAFEVAAGEVLCLIGPPGAGKSTLLRLLAGLESPTSGAVWLRGERFGEMAPVSLKRTVTMVFQQPLLLTGTVRSNVEYGLRLRGDADRATRAMKMLERVHLAHLADRPATAVSGGEVQLVALARALAFGPDVLLLDEPTNNLDPARVALAEEVVLADHKSRGTTMVWVTHNHFQARRAGGRVALLLEGKVIEVAEAVKFFESPKDPRTIAFVRGQMVY